MVFKICVKINLLKNLAIVFEIFVKKYVIITLNFIYDILSQKFIKVLKSAFLLHWEFLRDSALTGLLALMDTAEQFRLPLAICTKIQYIL